MNFHVLTLFPEMIEQGVNTRITGRVINNGLLSINAVIMHLISITVWMIIHMAAVQAC